MEKLPGVRLIGRSPVYETEPIGVPEAFAKHLFLNGVVIVETLFNYKGFGWTLVQAAGNNDIQLLLGCSVVAVLVVLVTQLISDVGYIFLNPRIRIS